MPNKIRLEKNGLVVGDTQLVTSGGGVNVGQNLSVNGNIYAQGNAIVSGLYVNSLIGTTYTNTSVTGGLNLDCSLYNTWVLGVRNGVDLRAINIPTGHYIMYLYVTFLGGSINSFPTGVTWPTGTAPTQTGTFNKTDIFALSTPNNGTNWYATVIGQNY